MTPIRKIAPARTESDPEDVRHERRETIERGGFGGLAGKARRAWRPVGGTNKKLILAAMIFAVSMTFIDMTIVAIAVPSLQDDLSLSSTGVQWIINGYLLSLSALFAFGGRLADIAGHRSMVVLGVIVFATASALCGATPTGSLDEAWIITFRVIQGAGAAIMFPAALAIVLGAFPVHERGRALAIFFAITGGLTSIGPLAGGYLVEIRPGGRSSGSTSRSRSSPSCSPRSPSRTNDKHPAPLDYRGAVLISGGMGLAVLGLQQSSVWGWGNPITWICIAAGIAVLVAFVLYELRIENPLIQVRIFADRAFAVDNAILFLLMIPFVPLFFFASMYAQISLGESASETGLYLLIFFAGFATASQWGGQDARQSGGAALRWCWAARSPPPASASGRTRCPTSRSARSGTGSSSPEPGSASSSARPTPTRSTACPPAATARRPGSRRPCATSAPASAWRCSARS